MFALVASKAKARLQTGYVGFMSLRGETPSYLAVNCELIAIADSGRRHVLRSADANALIVPTNLHSARIQEFFGGGTDSMEQSFRHTAKTEH